MFKINKGLPVWRILSLAVVLVFGILSIVGTGNNDVDFGDPYDIADAGPDQHLFVGNYVRLDGSGSNTPLGADPGDNSVIYHWEIVQRPAGVPVSGSGAAIWDSDTNIIYPAFISAITPGEYVIQLTVRYNGHSGMDTVKITTYSDANDIPPIANAGADIVAKNGVLVELNASDSFNRVIDRTLTYNWYMTESPLDSTSALSSTEVVNPSFIAEFNENDMDAGKSHYEVGLRAIDENDRISTADHVDVHVYPSEGYVHPTPIAGPEQRVWVGTLVNLDGSESFDVDGRPLSHEWQFYSRPPGSHAVLSNANTQTPFFTPDIDGVYVVFLAVDNGELNSSSDLIDPTNNKSLYDRQYQDRVKVIATLSAPKLVSILGPDQRIAFAGSGSLILDASRSTSDNYEWWLINKPDTSNATVVISDSGDPNGAQLNYDMVGDYVVKMRAQQSVFPEYDLIVYKVTSNTPPVADAGADQNVTANFPVTLNGSGSSDADLDTVAYSWSLVSTPVDWTSWPGEWPLLSEGKDASPTFTPTMNGEYRLRLTVNDRELSSVADEVLITVTGSAANSAPTADAGVDQSVTVGDTVSLDGAGSSDPDSDTLIYNWTIEVLPSGSSAAIGDPSSETPSFVADAEGSYEVQLIVNDGLVNSNPDTMTVTAGACANPLTLMTSLPFAPGVEMATNIQIDAEGIDTLSVITADAPPVDADVYQARIPDPSNPDQADFIVYGSNWEEISRTHANPISDSDSPSFVVRNIVDDIYYKINVDFTGTSNQEVQIDALSGCRCGSNAGDCP